MKTKQQSCTPIALARMCRLLIAIVALFTAIPAFAQDGGSDPSGWTNADIGSSYGLGFSSSQSSDSYSGGTLTISGMGEGALTYGTPPQDQFHYAYYPVPSGTPNFRLVCEVTSVTPGTGGGAPQVGLLLRSSTNTVADEAGAAYAPLAGYNHQNAADELGTFQWDTQTIPTISGNGVGWLTNGSFYPQTITTPFWLEMVKDGNNVAEYKSSDGVNWAVIANVSGQAYQAASEDIGIYICGGQNSSGTDYNAGTATITNISLNMSPVLSYETSWIGDTTGSVSTGHIASIVDASWTDATGNTFTNFLEAEDNGAPYWYSPSGQLVDELGTNWANYAFSGVIAYGEEGSITGDNNGNLYFWGGKGIGSPNATYNLYMSAETNVPGPTVLPLSPEPATLTGLAYDSNLSPPILYASDPTNTIIRAVNPATQTEITADEGPAPANPGPMTIDGSGNLWIISEGNTPGSGTAQPVGAPCATTPASVYCYVPVANGSPTQAAISITGVMDTTLQYQTEPIQGASYPGTIVITTTEPTPLYTGQQVTISGVQGNTAANGTWTITRLTSTTFSLNGSNGNAAFQAGGSITPSTGMTVGWDPTAICYDHSGTNNRLLVTDNGPDQDIKVFNLTGWTSGTKSSPDSSIGAVGGLFSGTTPGLITDASGNSERFYGLCGVGTDSSGNIYVAQNYNYSKVNLMADVRKFNSSGVQQWDDAGLTWVDCGSFDEQTGDFYTNNMHYRMNYGNGSGGEWSQYSFLWDPFVSAVPPTDSDPASGNSEQLGDYENGTVTRRINGNLYLFEDCGQGLIYQIDMYRMNGEQMAPCGSLFPNQPAAPYGFQLWSDLNGNGVIDLSPTDEVSTSADFLTTDDFDVDTSGNIWLAEPGYQSNVTVLEVLNLTPTGATPTYSMASSSDYNLYNLPTVFPGGDWSNPRLRYVASTNTMYLFGYMPQLPSASYDAMIECVNNVTSTAPTIGWVQQLPVPDMTPIGFAVGNDGYGNFQYMGFDVVGDKVFVGEYWGPIHVYDAVTGAPVNELSPGPEVSGEIAGNDCYKAMYAYYNPADNEYNVVCENAGNEGKQNYWRWSPATGSPSPASWNVTSASDAEPIVITTSSSNNLVTGDTVQINGVLGNTAANGTWTITRESSTQFALTTNYWTGLESDGNAAYASGTGTVLYGGVPGDQDFDSPGDAGSSSQSAGTYKVSGGGAGYGLSGGKDQANLSWSQLDGNGSIAAQVTGLSGSSAAAASAGVMFRNGITAAGTDPDVFLVVTQSNGLVFKFRPSAGVATVSVTSKSGISPSSDEYIMLVRSTVTNPGDSFAAYYSANGVEWTQLGSTVTSSGTGYSITDGVVTFMTPMNLTAYEGLAVTAASNSSLATGTFDRVLVGPAHLGTPATPAGFSAASGNACATLSWQYSPSDLAYNVYRGTSASNLTLLKGDVGGLSYNDATVANGSTYYYAVTGIAGGGESAKTTSQKLIYQSWNPSFEWPLSGSASLWPYGYDYMPTPAQASWTFTYAGVTQYDSTFDSATIPNGTQAAWIQNTGSVAQTLSGFVSSKTYTVTFYAANDTGYSTDPVAVYMDSTLIGTYTPSSDTTYTQFSFTYKTGASDPGSHTLTFEGSTSAGGDCVVDVDDVVFNQAL